MLVCLLSAPVLAKPASAWQVCVLCSLGNSVFTVLSCHQLRNLCQTWVYLSPVQNALSDFQHQQPTVAKIYFIPYRLITESSELALFCFGFSDCTVILCAKKPLKRKGKSARDCV